MEDTRRSGLRALFGRLRHHLRRELLAQGRLDPGSHRRVVLEVLAGVLLALADAFAVAAVPGAGLLDQLGVHAQVDQLAFAADALAVEDLGDDLLERRRHLVLDHLDLGLVADDLVALLRSEEHTSELQSLMRISYAFFCLKKKNKCKHKDITRSYK